MPNHCRDDKNNNEPNTTRSMAPNLFLKHNSIYIGTRVSVPKNLEVVKSLRYTQETKLQDYVNKPMKHSATDTKVRTFRSFI